MREIEDVRGLRVQSLGTNVLRHTDDPPVAPVGAHQPEALPHGVAFGKVPRHHRFGNHHDGHGIGGIRIGNRASAHNRDAQRFEIPGQHIQDRGGRIVTRISGLSGRHETRGRKERERRRETDRTHRFDARNLPQFASRRLKVVMLGAGSAVGLAAERVPDSQHVGRFKAPGLL